MKKFMTIFCIACLSVSAIAQSGVRIGNYVFHVQKAGSDSITNVYTEDDPCPPCPSENETRPKPKTFRRFDRTESFGGIGLILPDNSRSYYKILDGNSIYLEVGGVKTYHLTNWFALGGTLQYSYYNYRLKSIDQDPVFKSVVLGGESFDSNFQKQAFRSHNVAFGVFTRFHLLPPRYNNDKRLFVDLGAQVEYAVFRHHMVKYAKKDKDYYKNDAFNPFNASAVARIGWKNNRAIFANYRLTEAFDTKTLPMDLPRFTIGIQFF